MVEGILWIKKESRNSFAQDFVEAYNKWKYKTVTIKYARQRCRYPGNKNNDIFSNVGCFNCNDAGHKAKDCLNPTEFSHVALQKIEYLRKNEFPEHRPRCSCLLLPKATIKVKKI